ncbi:MAG: nitric oxide reductase activation protein NorD, partial [Dysosmobacter welbionis]
TMEDMIDQEADGGHIWLSIRSGLLSYMLWGELKYGGTPLSDERIQMVFSLLGDLDKALVSRDARNRCRTANLILIRCWPHIKDLLVTLKEQADNAASEGGGSGPGDPNDLLNSILSALAGGSEEGTGDTSPVGGSPAPSSTSATGSRRNCGLAAGSADGGSEEQAGKERSKGLWRGGR